MMVKDKIRKGGNDFLVQTCSLYRNLLFYLWVTWPFFRNFRGKTLHLATFGEQSVLFSNNSNHYVRMMITVIIIMRSLLLFTLQLNTNIWTFVLDKPGLHISSSTWLCIPFLVA